MSFLQKLIHSKKEAPPTEEEILQQIIAGQDYSVLPEFVYYPRAYEDGTIQAVENTVCPCCGKEVPCLYTGHFHFLDHGHGQEFKGVCPWCIASGAAARKFHGVFCKVKDITDVPAETQALIRERTPCFDGWKEEQWFSHCGDMMEYLGTAGYEELLASVTPARFKVGQMIGATGLLLGIALAMYRRVDADKQLNYRSMFLSTALAVFLTGVTEPLEFMFMFCALPLYIVYAVLQGCAFAMAGIIDLRLHSFGNLEFFTRIMLVMN